MNKAFIVGASILVGLSWAAVPTGGAEAACSTIRCGGSGTCIIRTKMVRTGGVKESTVKAGRAIVVSRAEPGDQWCQVRAGRCAWQKLPLGRC